MEDFTDLVQKWFSFLVKDDGFTCRVEGARKVVYSSSAAIIRIGLGERGGAGVTVDQHLAAYYYPFSFYLRIFFPDEAARLDQSEAKSRLELDIAVMRLANLLKLCGRPIIEGDAEVFRRMAAEASASF